MEIVGYADRFSVQPGEDIRFMVSCTLPSYRADIVRLIHGDENPKGPGYKEQLIHTLANGEYSGRTQVLRKGSCVIVPDSPWLRAANDFTIQAWIYPTTPSTGVQGILTKWSPSEGVGYGLFVGQGGGLSLWLGSVVDGVERIGGRGALRTSEWYFVAATYDARSRKVCLWQEPLTNWPVDDSRAVIEQSTSVRGVGDHRGPLVMAGYLDEVGLKAPIIGGHFNGKIDSPRLFARALSLEELENLKQDASPEAFDQSLIAAWDFAADISSARVRDTSSHGLHGETVNMPTRAVTGHNWTGHELNFSRAPKEYGGIHFHDDDLEDAGWEVDFQLEVPEEMKSGVYAARLRTGDSEDYVPFFVRPKKGRATAGIAFLAPTLSYMAYANEHGMADPVYLRLTAPPHLKGAQYPAQPQDRYIVEQGLSSLYDRHTDGSGVCYSSRLRPILNMRPKYYMSLLGGYPHQFNADLHLLDWMEAKGHQYDVITDEDLHWKGRELLAPYRVIVTGTHPEYWSGPMLKGLEEYLGSGGRLMYLGGNGFYWVTSLDPERPHVIEVRRWRGTGTWEVAPGEGYHSTTGEPGSLWRFRGKAPQQLVGVGFTTQGVDRGSPYRRQPGSSDPRAAFIFEGIGEDELVGDFPSLVLEHGAAGFEMDRWDHALGTPPHALLLASSFGHSDAYQHVIEEVPYSNSKEGGSVQPLVRSDIVYFECPNGGAVFSVGSITWCAALSQNGYDNNVSRITDNVLTRFDSDDHLP